MFFSAYHITLPWAVQKRQQNNKHNHGTLKFLSGNSQKFEVTLKSFSQVSLKFLSPPLLQK